jgi:hypothetical protein
MLRTIQAGKMALGLCLIIVFALLWIPQTMSAAKVTTPSGLQYVDLTVGNGDVAKVGDQVSVHYTGSCARSVSVKLPRAQSRPAQRSEFS